ncbi:MAG: DUF4272 domain-containing protein [Lachnospiraceae bacterium]|nr:DUF4272 domain-containing protein [Lachnospiraceae bacterium]
MKAIEEIIGRAEILLCLLDRRGLEYNIEKKTLQQREQQRLLINDWINRNHFGQYMTDHERKRLERKTGSPMAKLETYRAKYEEDAIEPLLWALGLTKRLSSYNCHAVKDWSISDEYHMKLKTNTLNPAEEIIEKIKLKSEEEILLRKQVAELWLWRVREGKKRNNNCQPINEAVLDRFGDTYSKAVVKILQGQKGKKQDFILYNKCIFEIEREKLSDLSIYAFWRYHAFEWLLSSDEWTSVRNQKA